ncbi:substrate-binding periplasmic protein [Hydrogenophaga defluvii]|uniref:Substrate-binding periplasmic protein n=1 Tax=Hydrogenophaga defluvii TaxID=249410 RepID=A0ABW2SEZ9_9BURK
MRLGAWVWASLATAVAGVVAGVVVVRSVAADPEAEPPANTTVSVIGVEDDWPPFAWVDGPGQPPRGYAVEVVRLVFRNMGVPVELVVMPFGRCMHETRIGKIAGCFNSVFSDDIRKDYALHSTPLFNEPLAVLARTAAPRQTIDANGLEGRTVGFVQGYQYPNWFMNNKAIVRVSAASDSALLLMLERGRIELAVTGATVAAWRLQTNPELRNVQVRMVGQVSNDGFGVAFSKQHPHGEVLRKGFDQELLKLQATDGLRELQRKHLPLLSQ